MVVPLLNNLVWYSVTAFPYQMNNVGTSWSREYYELNRESRGLQMCPLGQITIPLHLSSQLFLPSLSLSSYSPFFFYYISILYYVFLIIYLKTKFFYVQGESVRPYEIVRSVVNFGMLELTYRLQTFRDYSYSSQVPCEKRSNFIIITVTSVRPF